MGSIPTRSLVCLQSCYKFSSRDKATKQDSKYRAKIASAHASVNQETDPKTRLIMTHCLSLTAICPLNIQTLFTEQPTWLTTSRTYDQLSNQLVEVEDIEESVEYVKGELTN